LERAENGTVADYILTSDRSPLLKQRLTWCREATEAVAWIHARRILHCDIQPTNLLLDKKLHIKLSDFQGKQLSENGEVVLDGWSGEPCRFYCPRDDPFDANVKTDQAIVLPISEINSASAFSWRLNSRFLRSHRSYSH
jgi:serine/threonine protein kinase